MHHVLNRKADCRNYDMGSWLRQLLLSVYFKYMQTTQMKNGETQITAGLQQNRICAKISFYER